MLPGRHHFLDLFTHRSSSTQKQLRKSWHNMIKSLMRRSREGSRSVRWRRSDTAMQWLRPVLYGQTESCLGFQEPGRWVETSVFSSLFLLPLCSNWGKYCVLLNFMNKYGFESPDLTKDSQIEITERFSELQLKNGDYKTFHFLDSTALPHLLLSILWYGI